MDALLATLNLPSILEAEPLVDRDSAPTEGALSQLREYCLDLVTPDQSTFVFKASLFGYHIDLSYEEVVSTLEDHFNSREIPIVVPLHQRAFAVWLEVQGHYYLQEGGINGRV